MIAFEAALALVMQSADRHRLASTEVLLEHSVGRVLATQISAPFDVPGFRHAAMDGYAIVDEVAPADRGCWQVVGRVLAGDAPFRAIKAGEAVNIATGAVVLEGASRVVPVEAAELLDDQRVRLNFRADAPNHVRGANDDYARGDVAIEAGTRVGFAALGVMASFGLGTVKVSSQPRVAVMVTGSELVAAEVSRAPGRIHDSNSSTLHGLLRAEGIAAVSSPALADDEALLRARLVEICAHSDVVITTGGASAGQADFMPRLLAELGEVTCWKVAMRPGMPVLFGRIGGCMVFGLPGNPVAVVAAFLALVRPALAVMQGAAAPLLTHARLTTAIVKSHDRLEFRRATLSVDAFGIARATPHPALSSGVLRSVLEGNALIMLDAARHSWDGDDVVAALCYS